jgi:hypothetical protein
MKKLISIISSFLLITIVSANAEMGIGISGAAHMFDASGTETTRTSNQKNSGNHSETVVVPEIFVEAINDDGLAIGVSYIPTRDVGSKSRSDSNTDGDTGTYKAQAELDNVFKLYADIPTSASIAGGTVYVHLGVQHVTLATLESLNSGATYPNKDLFGGTIGLGTKGDIPYGNNLYYKTEVTYTNFETYEADGAGNKVVADLEDIAARLSIGYKF